MNRLTAPWTAALAVAALITVPAAGFGHTSPPPQDSQQQTPQPPTTPPPAQPPATPPPADPPALPPPSTQPPVTPPATPPPATPPPVEQPAKTSPTPQKPTADTAREHLSQASTALAKIEISAVTGTARTKLNDLKRHMAALERSVAANDSASATAQARRAPRATAPRGHANWATEVAAIDKVLADLVEAPATAGSETPAPTTGTTGAPGTRRRTPAAAPVTIDDTTRTALLDVRKHVTEFAAAMSATAPPATQTTPSDPAAAAASTPAKATMGNAEAARRALTEARDILSDLTKLPEAAQLSGDARTQASQLITNFNELITTQSEWRTSFGKVQGNLNALIGSDTAAAAAPPPAGTPGAVGTSGTTIDPKVRAKLIEFRAKIAEFERIAGETKK